jgi:uncharacterized protein (UPF0335 family)
MADGMSNSATMNQELGAAFERFKALEHERKSIVEDQADLVNLLAEKFDLKAKNIRKAWMLAIKPPDPSDLNEIATVEAALGDFVATPLGGSAVDRAAKKFVNTLGPGDSLSIREAGKPDRLVVAKDKDGNLVTGD